MIATMLARPLAAVVLMFAAAAGAQNDQTVRIGVAAPLSGPGEGLGKGMLRGAQLAAEQINAAGGVKLGNRNARLEIVSGDDKADPEFAAAVAGKLLSQGVVAVVGHLNSGCSMQAAPIYAAADVVQVSPASSNPSYTRLGIPTTNRVVGSDRRQGEVMALHAVKKLGVKSVVVLSDDTEYGNALSAAFAGAAELLGARIAFRGAIPEGIPNVDRALATVKAMNADAIYFGGMDTHAAEIARALRELGVKAPLLLGDGGCTVDFVKAAGKAGANMVCSIGEMELGRLPRGRDFDARYRKRFGGETPVYAPYAYDAVYVIAQALRTAGTAERDALVPAVRSASIDGVTGRIAFDRWGDLVDAPVSIYRSGPGGIVFVATLQ